MGVILVWKRIHVVIPPPFLYIDPPESCQRDTHATWVNLGEEVARNYYRVYYAWYSKCFQSSAYMREQNRVTRGEKAGKVS